MCLDHGESYEIQRCYIRSGRMPKVISDIFMNERLEKRVENSPGRSRLISSYS